MRDELNIQDAADVLDRTVEDVTQRWANINDENREVERRCHERQRARQKLQNRGQLKNPPINNQAPPAVPAAVPAVAPAVAPAVSPTVPPAVDPTVPPAVAPAVAPTVGPEVCPAVARAVARAVAPAAAPAQKQRRFFQSSRKPENRNAVPVHAAPESVPAAPEPVPTIAYLRGRRWAYVEDIEDEDGEAERRGHELQRDREQFQNLRQPNIPTVTNQVPSAAPAAQQHKGGSVWSTSRKPANRNLVTGYAAPKPVPENAFFERQRSSLSSYKLLDSERRRYATGSTSARLRPTHRYRSPTPQGRKDREQSTVEQPNKPAVVQVPNQGPFGVPGNASEPSRTVWTKALYGWESREIGRID